MNEEDKIIKVKGYEIPEYIHSYCVEPVTEEMGIDFESYMHTFDKPNSRGCHIITFEMDKPCNAGDMIPKRKGGNINSLDSILELLEDDNQPDPIFDIYFGTLIIYVYYFA